MVSELDVFGNYEWKQGGANYIYLAAAGFEDRACRGVELLAAGKVPLSGAVVLEFREQVISENQQNLDRMIRILKESAHVDQIQVLQSEMVEQLWDALPVSTSEIGPRVIVDVTAMSHNLVLRALRTASRGLNVPLVLYTEAEEYYPTFAEAEKYLRYDDDEIAFDVAAREEHKGIMYAGLASIGTVKGFEGCLLPTAPTSAILFPTFKRLRISAILSELEVNRRVFLLGEPVRDDLKWRERALRIINYDLIDPNTDSVLKVTTLSPSECFSKLDGLLKDGIVNPRGNVIICPHGSKMQTVGVWRFCTENPDVRAVLSQPKEFFPKKYSTGFRDTFVFDPAIALDRHP